jgi:methyltransferase (TIGR00027 family)
VTRVPVPNTTSSIQGVADTARWVAMYRAIETERPDAVFHDPYARRLAGERGERIIDALANGRKMSWPMVVRTVVFDDFVMKAVREDGADTVLNLAAGLDARPWRLPLPESLRWIDVDLPEILGYKQQELANETPKCRYEARAVDLRDEAARRALFADVGGSSRKTLVITEGLLIYLPPESVAALARDLASQPSFRWWIIDLISPALLQRLSKTWGNTLQRSNAPFLFAPADNTRFFAPHGWREREYRSVWTDAKRLDRRMAGAWMWDLMAVMMPPDRKREMGRFAGNVMLESAAPESHS